MWSSCPLSVLTIFSQASFVRMCRATGTNEAAAALNGLMGGYNPTSGLWDLDDNHAAWWQSAVALQATLDFMTTTGSHDYLPLAEYTITAQRAPVKWWPQGGGEFRADSTDDTGWWALALLSMYSITSEQWLLDIAITDEAYMAQYWTASECNGGLIWQIRDLSYKAAISNELYIELAATLHNQIPGDSKYLRKSLIAWEWFKTSGMINSGFLINDGLMRGPGGTCLNNNAPTWTYNQGVILGGLVELWKATGNEEFLDAARAIANAVVASSHLAPSGILNEPCPDGVCTSPDQQSFKGIFMRYLAKLNVHLSDRPYNTFIRTNAEAMFAADRLSSGDGSDLYGPRWQGPFGARSLGSQQSALMLLTASMQTWKDHSSTRTMGRDGGLGKWNEEEGQLQ